MEHAFTPRIKAILKEKFGALSEAIYAKNPLLQYLNLKTVSATRGSKARGNFGNIYAVYVLVEDYVKGNFHDQGDYANYTGAQFSVLLKRQRSLPFGSKLQNHALNHRMNQEYRKLFPQSDFTPIMRDVDTNRYWINENLLEIEISDKKFNIAEAVLEIVKQYIRAKQSAFDDFIETCENLKRVNKENEWETRDFISSLLEPNVDARIMDCIEEVINIPALKERFDEAAQENHTNNILDEIVKQSKVEFNYE